MDNIGGCNCGNKNINVIYNININGIGTSNNIGNGRGSSNSNMIEIIENPNMIIDWFRIMFNMPGIEWPRQAG